MGRYTWPDVGQQEGSIAGSRLADQVRAFLGAPTYSAAAARDAAIAELLAGATPVFNVLAYGAQPTFSSDQAPFIQLALDAAAAAGGGTVLIPYGSYLVSTLRFYSRVSIQGAALASAAGAGGTQLYQASATGPILKPNDPSARTSGFAIRDIALSAFGNANNQGGLDLTNCILFDIERVQLSGCKQYMIRMVGGPTAGDAGFGNIRACQLFVGQTDCAYFLFSGSANDQPDGISVTDCYCQSGGAATGIKFIEVASVNGSHAPTSLDFKGCRFEANHSTPVAAIVVDANGAQLTVKGCRFENTGSGGLTVTVASVSTQPPGLFSGNHWAAGAGGLTWTDNGSTNKASRLGEFLPSSVTLFQFGGQMTDRHVVMTHGATPACNVALGNFFTLSITANIAVVIAVPTGAPPAGFSQEITIVIRNASGGALSTAPTFNTGAGGFRFAAVTNPANGTQVAYKFRWDPVQSLWYEVGTHLAAGL